MSNKTTSFGFKSVSEQEKPALVRGVFDAVASRYDIMNDLMSAGLHRWWKHEMVTWLNPQSHWRVLDVAGGTGDIAFRIKNRCGCDVVISDINYAMLAEGRNRAIDRNILPPLPPGEGRGEGAESVAMPSSGASRHLLPKGEGYISWLCADAEALPLPDRAFDAYTIAFGIRNVTHIDRALKEARRVLKPGGRFLCLEFSHLAHEWLQKAYDLYSFNVIPKIGEWVTGSGDPYKYLVESIRKFPPQEEFADLMREAGFGNVQYRNLTQGVVAIHSGRRL